MTPVECVKLCQFIAARCPAMRIDEHTPDAWYLDLAHVDPQDGWEAAAAVTRRQNFISLAELLDEARRVERARLGQKRHLELAAQLDDRDGEPLPLGHPKRQLYADKVRRALNASRSLATPSEITE